MYDFTNTAVRRIAPLAVTAAAIALLGVSVAQAADPAPTGSDSRVAESKETRQKMADLHEQMAACLRSDKPLAECRAEMMKGCHDSLGAQSCPMMGMDHGKAAGGRRQRPMNSTDAGR